MGAGREAAQLAGEQNRKARLPSLTAAGATATPQPSDWAGRLGDRGEGCGERTGCGKAAHAPQNIILALPPPFFPRTSFPEHFTTGWDRAKGAKSERKRGIWPPLPLLRAPSSFVSEEELSRLQEPSVTADCIREP